MPATNVHILVEEQAIFVARAESLKVVHEMVERFWSRADQLDEPTPNFWWRVTFLTALGEIVANIIDHAYPAEEGPIALRLRLYIGRVEARLADQGDAYASQRDTYALDGQRQNLADVDTARLPEGGFGLMIARSALDRLSYRRTPSGVNCWCLVKRYDF